MGETAVKFKEQRRRRMVKNTTKKKSLRILIFLLACTGCLCFAACSKEKILYSFRTNGGDAIAEAEVEKGGAFTLPVPERDGYEFEGWYTTEDFSGSPLEKIDAAQENLTFYAKWAKKYTVTLRLNGGTLSVESIQTKAGVNLYELLQSYLPEKSGYVFGAWFDANGNELSKSMTMPENDVTLSAKYKVGYTVQIFRQNIDRTDYVKDETDLQYYDYAGTQVKANETLRGFKETNTENTVASLQLTETASENVLKLYFNRETFTVRFDGNYPDGSVGDKRDVSVVYGEEIKVPCDYATEGYCLTGWATTKSGAAEYKTGNVDLALYGNDGATDTSDVFAPDRNMTLYAVWSKGYTDMFGGDDYIYLFGEEEQEIYLCRDSVFFKGNYKAENASFTFKNGDGEFIGKGKIVSEDMFAYEETARKEITATLYKMSEGKKVDAVYLKFDGYNGLTYCEKSAEEGAPVAESDGVYVKDADGYYKATFTTGVMQGKTLTFFLGALNNGETVFVARNDEEVIRLPRLFVSGSSLITADVAGSKGYMDLTLDGFGVASLNSGTEAKPEISRYYYVKNGDTITLKNSSRADYAAFRVIEYNGKQGYYPYFADLDKTITAEDGSSLTLNGLYQLSYRNNGGVVTEGVYTFSQAILGDYIVNMVKGNETYRFLISSVTEEKLNGEGKIETVTTYLFERKGEGYAEYYYQNTQGTQPGPLLVVDDKQKGSAALYEYIAATKTYVKASAGTYTYDAQAKLYTYTATQTFGVDGGTGFYDVANLQTAVFALDTESTSYKIYYWYSADYGETVENYEKQYANSSEGVTLKKIGGIMVLNNKGVVTSGAYTTSSSGITAIQSGNGAKVYVKIDESTQTFEALWTSPFSAYLVNEYGATDRTRYLTFDGTGTPENGGATYTFVTGEKDGGGNAVVKTYAGTFEKTEKTHPFTSDIKIYRFTGVYNGENLSFEFLRIIGSSSVLIFAHGGEENTEYVSKAEGRLTLDGYGYMAIYTDGAGNNTAGVYSFSSAVNDLAYIQTADGEVYLFDLKAGNTFTIRGNEYGTYCFVENQEPGERFAEMDGYGKLAVYTLEKVTEGASYEKRYIDKNGSYVKNGDVFVLRYTAGGDTVEVTGELKMFASGNNSLPCFVVYQKDVVAVTYVNPEDWSLMTLDRLGNAVKYDKKGVRETGVYTLITDELLYYVNAEGTDACVYAYDSQEKTVRKQVFGNEFSYFTRELDSMLFTKYGVAVLEGERCYYKIDENDRIIVYKKSATGGNEFGYIGETFLETSEQPTKDYNGKTYYKNDGYALRFTRDVSSKEKYPLTFSDVGKVPTGTLDFTPAGAAEYSVSGTVTFEYKENDETKTATKSCTVTRRASESGVYVMYMTVNNHRFDISVNYNGAGADNTYTVSGLAMIYSYSSFNYTFYSYLYSMMGGVSPLKNPGTLSVKAVYDENGDEISRHIVSAFTAESGFTDSNGDLFEIDADYTMENGIFVSDFTAKDGKNYRLYMQSMNRYGISGYAMMITRVETLTDGEYTVTVERVAASDGGYAEKSYFSMRLKKGETEYAFDTVFRVDGAKPWVYVVRTYDEDKKIVSSVYYEIALTEETTTVDEDKMAFFVSVAVTEKAVSTYYTAAGETDGKSFTDVHASEGVKLIVLDGAGYIVTESVYDESTQTYTAKTSSGKTFTVKITDGGTAEITETTEATDGGNE